MTVSYSASLKSTRMQAVITAIDAGSTFGFIEIGTAGMAAVLGTVTLSKPSFTESGGVITMAGAPKTGSTSAAGTAANARIKDSAGNVIVASLTVGTSGSDINLNTTTFSSGMVLGLSSFAITHTP